MKTMDILYISLPAIIGYSTSGICKIGKNAGKSVLFRPPAAVFGIVWAILFILLGISWSIAIKNSQNKTLCNSLYLLLSISLGLWTYVYGCKGMKKEASWVILLSIMLSLMCYSQGNEKSRILISPLIAWILFAVIMNTTEVQTAN